MSVSPVQRDGPFAAEMEAPVRAGAERAELTVRAVAAGCSIGAVLAAANVYTGLKLGWGDQGNITASLAGFGLFAFARRFTRCRYGPLENNITQTVASSAAGMSFTAGLVSAFPALSMMGYASPSWAITGWAVALGGTGVLIALLLRERLIFAEKLPFPSGIATAEVIDALHRKASSALGRARALAASAAAAMAVVWLRDGKPAWIPQLVRVPWRVADIPIESLKLGLNSSPLLLGTGLLIGPRNALSLLLGSLLAWIALAPLAVRHAWVRSTEFAPMSDWLLWPGVALMAASALTSLFLQWKALKKGLLDLLPQPSSIGRRAFSGHLWLAPAALAFSVALIGRQAFGLHPIFTLTALASSVLLAGICARATGETDIAPVTQMGQLTQLSVGMAAPSPVANVLSGAVASGTAAQTSQTLWSLKAGALLKASPRSVICAQVIGVALGALVVVPAFRLVCRAYGLGSEALPAPAAASSRALAEVMRSGVAGLPPGASAAAAGAAIIGVLLALAERNARGRFLPSPVAMGVGFLQPASFGLTIGLGAACLLLARRINPQWTGTYGETIASGTIAGESLLGVVVAALVSTGILKQP